MLTNYQPSLAKASRGVSRIKSSPAVSSYVAEAASIAEGLAAAELTTEAIDQLFARANELCAAMRSDELAIEDTVAVALSAGVIRLDQSSTDAVIESIERYFIWRVNDADSRLTAQRATPW